MWKPSAVMKSRGIFFSTLATSASFATPIFQRYGRLELRTIVGITLFSGLALLPPMLQNLMGFPVIETGLLMGPRGIGTMVAMMIVGRVIGRVDPRLIFGLGLALIAYTLWEMTGYTLDTSEALLIRTGIVQGFGLGFVFIPLSTITFTTLGRILTLTGVSPSTSPSA
jgi:DHA2 family multidrug resistance protein